MPVRCTIIKLSYKMSRSPLIEVYTKLMLAATTLRIKFSYQQNKRFSLTAKLFWSLKTSK